MVQTIHCNGGPWHDQVTQVPNGRDHFHILEAPDLMIARAIAESNPEAGFQALRSREGMYSQVHTIHGSPVRGEYEWDGWRSHD